MKVENNPLGTDWTIIHQWTIMKKIRTTVLHNKLLICTMLLLEFLVMIEITLSREL